ncbi:MAG: HAD family hydrolase [Cyanobacteria bacterium P01_D01_bin.115]
MVTVRCRDLTFEHIAAILWDKDGTLADSHAFLRKLAESRSQTLAHQFPNIQVPLMAAFGCADDQYDAAGLMAVGTRYENEIAAATYIAATGKPWAEAVSLAQVAFAESDRRFVRKADFTPPFPEIPNLLRQGQQQGLKQAVLSGDTTDNIADFLRRYDLHGAVDSWAGSEAPPVKPDPQMAWTACEQLGILPENCLVIGDSELDQQLARRSGCRGFVSVTWGGSPAIAGADAVLEQPQQCRIGVLNPNLEE